MKATTLFWLGGFSDLRPVISSLSPPFHLPMIHLPPRSNVELLETQIIVFIPQNDAHPIANKQTKMYSFLRVAISKSLQIGGFNCTSGSHCANRAMLTLANLRKIVPSPFQFLMISGNLWHSLACEYNTPLTWPCKCPCVSSHHLPSVHFCLLIYVFFFF